MLCERGFGGVRFIALPCSVNGGLGVFVLLHYHALLMGIWWCSSCCITMLCERGIWGCSFHCIIMLCERGFGGVRFTALPCSVNGDSGVFVLLHYHAL